MDIAPDPPKSFDAETVAILPAPRKIQGDWHEPLESGQHKKACHAVRFGVRVLFVNLKFGPIYLSFSIHLESASTKSRKRERERESVLEMLEGSIVCLDSLGFLRSGCLTP